MGLQLLEDQVIAPVARDGHKRFKHSAGGAESHLGINGRVVNEGAYWTNKNEDDVNVDDINNATIRFREEADDMLQVGQIVMIGRTVWVVEGRVLPTWGQGMSGLSRASATRNFAQVHRDLC